MMKQDVILTLKLEFPALESVIATIVIGNDWFIAAPIIKLTDITNTWKCLIPIAPEIQCLYEFYNLEICASITTSWCYYLPSFCEEILSFCSSLYLKSLALGMDSILSEKCSTFLFGNDLEKQAHIWTDTCRKEMPKNYILRRSLIIYLFLSEKGDSHFFYWRWFWARPSSFLKYGYTVWGVFRQLSTAGARKLRSRVFNARSRLYETNIC